MAPQFVRLEIPPGVVKPGTVYDARGRYYDTNLVRWYAKVLQPMGGWAMKLRTSPIDVSAAQSYVQAGGPAYTDETADANDAGSDDVQLVSALAQVGDYFYIGSDRRFTEVQIDVSTAEAGGTFTWEYWTAAGWETLPSFTDETDWLQTTGVNSIVWDLPDDWVTTTVNSLGPYYYVRMRVTSAAGSTGALAATVQIGRGPAEVGGPARGAHAWRTDSIAPYAAFGTPTALYLLGQGTLEDIAPNDLTAGSADASQSAAVYGAGGYGSGPYGVGDAAQSVLTPATTWQIDNLGEDLVACSTADGRILLYDTSAGGLAAAVTNAPTDCLGVVVTPEAFLVALGAGGNPRRVAWPDRDDITDWTAGPSDEAGGFTIASKGMLLAGRAMRSETLLWTDVDVHAMQYIGGEIIYGFRKVADLGAVSAQAMAVADGRAFWMGMKSFGMYDGAYRTLESDVANYVFSDINTTQISKVAAVANTAFNEIIWFYPSGSSTENDRYVVFNYALNEFYVGALARTTGVDASVFANPIWAAPSGVLYDHEVGTTMQDDGEAAQSPYATTGPIEIASGDRLMDILNIVPDEQTLGGVAMTIYAAMYPTAAETTYGPYTPSELTNVRITARQIRLHLTQAETGWKYGTPRLEVQPGSQR